MKVPSPVRAQKHPAPAAPGRVQPLLSPLGICIAAIVLAAGVFAIYSPALNFHLSSTITALWAIRVYSHAGHVWEYFTNYVWAQFQADR